MENFKAIDFPQSRDFSRKMNATFEFIRQNFKPLCKSILFIAGPPVLIASLLLGTFMDDFMGLTRAGAANPDAAANYFLSVSFWLQMIMMFVFLLVSSVMTLATINSYIILYIEKQSNQIEVNDVWDRVRSSFWMYLGTCFMFVVLVVAGYIVLIIPFALLAAVTPVLVVFGGIAFGCAMFYLFFSASLTFFIRSYEKKGFFEAISRSYKLIRGKWWSTFGLLMILYFIMATISYIFMIPYYVITVVGTLHTIETGAFQEPSSNVQLIMIISFTLYYMAQMLLNTLPNVGIAFQYFNLVELKEARGLISQIDTVGETQQPLSSEEQY
ncbi:MAG TPA: hypothetical protein VD884_00080 [Ohtaekwangia sp.]|nr:hypothetical protein [Ohtaekwangia sp.]